MKFEAVAIYEEREIEICWEDGKFTGDEKAVDWLYGVDRALTKQGLNYDLVDETSAYYFCNQSLGPLNMVSIPYEDFPRDRRHNVHLDDHHYPDEITDSHPEETMRKNSRNE